MTQEDYEFLIEQILAREIKDNGKRWYLSQEIYREVVKRAVDEAKSECAPFMYLAPKPE